jgi:hypothetical protein
MPEFHLRSMKASHNKSDVTNRFGDRDFVLAVYTCFLCNSDRFEVIRDFRSLNHGEIPFPVDRSMTSPFISWLTVKLFTLLEFSIYLLPFKSYSRISCVCNGKEMFQSLEAYITLRIFFVNLDTPKRHFLASIEALWSRWLFPFEL